MDTYVSAAHTYWTGVLRSAPNFSTNCEVSADAPNTRDNTPFRLCFLLIDRSNRLASFRHHNGREGMVAFCVLPSYGLTLGLYCSFPRASCGLRHCLLHTNARGQPQGAERVFGIRLPINLSIYASSVHTTMYVYMQKRPTYYCLHEGRRIGYLQKCLLRCDKHRSLSLF